MQGRIEQVATRTVGSTLFDDHLAGTAVLLVASSSPFSSEGADIVEIDGQQYVVTERIDSTVEGEPDTLAITPVLAADAEAGTTVSLVPKATEKIALVRPTESTEDAPWVLVPYEFSAQLPEGVREPEWREAVEFSRNADGQWVITELVGRTPVLGSEYLDQVPSTGPDGVVPSSSPVPSLRGTVGAILAGWAPTPNPDPVTYEVHIKEGAAAPAPTPGDVTTKLLTTPSTQAMIRSLPNGDPLNYGVDYSVWVISFDADGYGPVANPGIGRMVPVTTADVAADYVYAGEVTASQITGGNLNAVLALLGRIVAGNEGANRVEIGPDGISQYDQAGDLVTRFPVAVNEPNRLLAEVVTQALTVLGNMEIRGVDNEVSVDSILELAAGVTPPTQTMSVSDYLTKVKTASNDETFLSAKGVPDSIYSGPMANTGQVSWDANRSRFVWLRGVEPDPNVSGDEYPVLCAWNPATGAYSETAITSTASPRLPAAAIPSGYRDPDAVENNTAADKHKQRFFTTCVIGDYMYLLTGRFLYDMNPPGMFGYGGQSFWFVYRLRLTDHVVEGSTSPYRLTGVDEYRDTGYFGGSYMSHRNCPRFHRAADGNMWVSQVNATTSMGILTKRTPSTGAVLSTINLDVAAPSNIDYIAQLWDVTLPEGNRLVYEYNQSQTVIQADPANGARFTTEDWLANNGYRGANYYTSALLWDGTRFYTGNGYDGGGNAESFMTLYKHTTDTSPEPIHWSYTWYDDNPAGTGTHETTPAPLTTKARRRRWGQFASVSTYGRPPVAPGDPDSPNTFRVYGVKKATTPTFSELKLHTMVSEFVDYSTLEGARTNPDTGLPETGGAAPPATNSFPEGNSAQLKSSSGGFLLRGNGTGQWPALTDPLYAMVNGALVPRDGEAGEVLRTFGGDGGQYWGPPPSDFETGDIMTSARSSKTGWLKCDGSFVSITTYQNLYNYIGHTYNDGVNPGDGTFRLPDLVGRIPVGSGTGFPLGARGGSATKVIGEANLPPHTHGMDHSHSMAHTHTINHDHPNASVAMRSAAGASTAPVRGNSTADGSASVNIPSFSGSSGGSSAGSTGGASATVTAGGPGSSTPLDVQNPYQVINYFIKI